MHVAPSSFSTFAHCTRRTLVFSDRVPNDTLATFSIWRQRKMRQRVAKAKAEAERQRAAEAKAEAERQRVAEAKAEAERKRLADAQKRLAEWKKTNETKTTAQTKTCE